MKPLIIVLNIFQVVKFTPTISVKAVQPDSLGGSVVAAAGCRRLQPLGNRMPPLRRCPPENLVTPLERRFRNSTLTNELIGDVFRESKVRSDGRINWAKYQLPQLHRRDAKDSAPVHLGPTLGIHPGGAKQFHHPETLNQLTGQRVLRILRNVEAK